MRITGGALAGRIIRCPDGIIRPAMDRMRESVFAILGDLSGASWLDMFSGSGTVAIEAVQYSLNIPTRSTWPRNMVLLAGAS